MKIKQLLCAAVSAAALLSGCAKSEMSRTIVTDVPERPAGQEDMVGFAAEPIDTVRVGVIGLGMRGDEGAFRLGKVPGAKVVAVCDIDSSLVNRVVARM